MITTKAGYWRIECKSNDIIKIYHNNHNPDMGILYTKSGGFAEGFHKHQFSTQSIRDALEYINEHERNYLDLEK